MLSSTPSESAQRDAVVSRILNAVKTDTTIRLPRQPIEDDLETPAAMLTIVSAEYGGTVGDFKYLFEGEDDLLHVLITRRDLSELSAQEGLDVLRFLLPNVAPGLFWMKPGTLSQHFYVGHDVLLED